MLPGCAQPSISSSIIWLICCAPTLLLVCELTDTGMLPGCAKPSISSSIIWLICCAPTLLLVVVGGLGVAGAGAKTALPVVAGGLGVAGAGAPDAAGQSMSNASSRTPPLWPYGPTCPSKW